MSTIKIDDKEYDVESLSEEVKGNIVSLQTVDRKISEAQQELAILQTARLAYAKALKENLSE